MENVTGRRSLAARRAYGEPPHDVEQRLDLRVGELSETVTVSGQSPVIDVQNVVQQRVLTREVLESLPNAKSIQSLTATSLTRAWRATLVSASCTTR